MHRLDEEPDGTKRVLLLAAGELFAEHGLDGTSIRAIAEKAGTNVAAVNYHFGTKEKLYSEAVLYVVPKSPELSAKRYLEDRAKLSTSEGAAHVIRQLVHDRVLEYFENTEEPWRCRLAMWGLVESPAMHRELVDRVFRVEYDAMKTVFQLIRPGASDAEATRWVFSLLGQILIYIFVKPTVLYLTEREEYDQDFFDALEEHIAAVILRALELPLVEKENCVVRDQ